MSRSRILAVLLALVLAGALVVTGSAQDKPRYGGILNWFDYGDPGRLDVHAESPLVVQQATAGVYSGLLHRDPDDSAKIAPDLAERYTVSADGKTYTFQLRKGVKWHDGQPFTAADVKATFDRVLNPDFKSPKCGAALKPLVASVEVIDPHTVQIRLKAAAEPFLGSIASAWCRIAAKHVLEKYGDLNKPEAQIGTGPFKFKKYERGSLIEWEKNKDYFVPGLPYLDGVKQYILVGGPTQLAAAKAGRVMLWDTWPPMGKAAGEELKNARGSEVDVYRWPINTIWIVYMNTTKPPFDNPELRRAVYLALNRQELIGKALDGAGVPCAMLDPKLVGDFALPLEEVGKLPGCRQPKDQDLAEAEKLVKKHHPNGLDIEIALRQVGNYSDRAQLVAAQLRKIGIRGTLRTHESAAGYAAFGKGDFVLIAAQDRAMDSTDPSDVFSFIWTKDGGSNYARWSDPKVDELADRAIKETDRAKRRQLYHDLQRMVLGGAPGAVPVGWVEGWFFVDKRVRGYKHAATAYDNLTFMKVWLAQ
ncbi:MAG: ABC transporter substrate-binding protein [Candidatus Rokubacteria bacterium]|nr:ABC transporter substrate-binding protein [Candidatus Rokubacteria bacterium]